MQASTALAEAAVDDIPRGASRLRQALRTATAATHQRLDAQLSRFDLQSADSYRVFLEANAAALLPLEAALVASGMMRLVTDWPRRARTDAILSDLACLEGEARPLSPPDPFERDDMVGALYVLEGSRLGAAYLLKTVEQSPDPRVTAATAYLRHGEGQRLWPTFLTALDHHAPLIDEARAIGGAERAFALFEQAAARA